MPSTAAPCASGSGSSPNLVSGTERQGYSASLKSCNSFETMYQSDSWMELLPNLTNEYFRPSSPESMLENDALSALYGKSGQSQAIAISASDAGGSVSPSVSGAPKTFAQTIQATLTNATDGAYPPDMPLCMDVEWIKRAPTNLLSTAMTSTRQRAPGHRRAKTCVRAAPFLTKLYEIIESPETNDIIEWSDDGTCFRVHAPDRLERFVLPRYFKHNRFVFFTKQLRAYGFKQRIDTSSSTRLAREWYHEMRNFFRGGKKELVSIQRVVMKRTVVADQSTTGAQVQCNTAENLSTHDQSTTGTQVQCNSAENLSTHAEEKTLATKGQAVSGKALMFDSRQNLFDGDLDSNGSIADSDGNSGSGGSSGGRGSSDSGDGRNGGSAGSSNGGSSSATANLPSGSLSRDSVNDIDLSRPVSAEELRTKIIGLNDRVEQNRLMLREQRSLILKRIDMISERIARRRPSNAATISGEVAPENVDVIPPESLVAAAEAFGGGVEVFPVTVIERTPSTSEVFGFESGYDNEIV